MPTSQSCFCDLCILSIVTAFSVIEGAFRRLLRFLQSLFNLSSLTQLCCLCCDSSYIHDAFVLYFLFLVDVFSLERSLSYSPFMLRVRHHNKIPAHFFSPQAALSKLCTTHCFVFLFSHPLFSSKPANNSVFLVLLLFVF